MKRVVCVFLMLLTLSGCSGETQEMNRCLSLRERLLVNGCSFAANLTSDFGDKVFSFSMQCTVNDQGTLRFTVIAPEEISGIGGTIHAGKGELEYEDTILAFPMLAEGELAPVSAPWLLVSSLRGGYLTSCGMDEDILRITVHDSYEEDSLLLDVWVNEDDCPIYAEIFWHGRRVVSMEIKDFHFV